MRAWRCPALVGAALAAFVSASEPAAAQVAQLEPGDLLVTALASGRVYCLDPDDPANGCLDPAIADPEPVPTGGAFISPRGLAVDPSGLLLVADNGPTADGSKTLSRVDAAADARAVAALMIFTTIPRGVAVTSDGRAFIANPGLIIPSIPQIHEASPSLGGVATIALAGSLRFPAAIAVETESPELQLLVADSGENDPEQGRINQGIVRVLPDAFNPNSPDANQQVFCRADVFATPRSLAIDADGTVLLTDSGDGTPAHPPRVFRIPATQGCPDPADPLGEIEIVAEGAPLVRPVGIAVDAAGTIYVADNLADTVFRIVPDANPGVPDPAVALFTPGSVDAWDLQLYRPDPSRIYVADAGARQVLAIDPLTASTDAVSFGAGSSEHASLEVVDAAAQRAVVADRTAAAILETQIDPASVTPLSQGGRLARPTSTARETTGTYLVTDLGDGTPARLPAVVRVDPALAPPADQSLVSEGGLLVHPEGGAIDGQGFLIVLDAGSATASPAVPPRILRISPDETLATSAGQKLLYEGPPLLAPTAITVDLDGTLLVTDAGDASNPPTLRRFFRSSLSPGLVSGIVLEASGDLLEKPAGVSVDRDRSVLVADAGASSSPGANDGAVLRIDSMSGLQSQIPTAGPLDEPTGIGAVPSPAGAFTDSDGDHFPDAEDNCVFVANADQRDTNSDGFGNVCDADYDDNGGVGASDLAALYKAFGSTDDDPPPSRYDPDIDSNGDGGIGSAELAFFGQCFGGPPGPSAFHAFDPSPTAPRCP